MRADFSIYAISQYLSFVFYFVPAQIDAVMFLKLRYLRLSQFLFAVEFAIVYLEIAPDQMPADPGCWIYQRLIVRIHVLDGPKSRGIRLQKNDLLIQPHIRIAGCCASEAD